MRFSELPYEIRFLIADHLLDWPDHKAFRQCDKTNYTLLTNRQSVRKRFQLTEWIQQLLDAFMQSVSAGSGLYFFLSTETATAGGLDRESKPRPSRNIASSESKNSADWFSFVHQNDCFATIRRMLLPDAIFSGYPYKECHDSVLEVLNNVDKHRRYRDYVRSHGGDPKWLPVTRDIAQTIINAEVTVNSEAPEMDEKLKDTTVRSALHEFMLHEVYRLLCCLRDLVDWMEELEEVKAIQRQAHKLLLDLQDVIKLWKFFNGSPRT
ncbi:hypothetical protein BJ508DRAFT_304699 [Ascobolus immersus RN42]|uniref:Uncharacterized protein n=1 Tax=Ascobolus immersus RN42 TaxID=1160509 RepID=A0A3N4IBP4_ASCIM|nr:hypothetical protein BJ508DRAFT_304699 [Ascobolus immersus RN42]